ncbi:hypothetical protein KA016_02885 [Candidatus Saccharibacteria bacterium]|jgi:hypothetical protein|nr:hypothetical protein [Candidatus Saccharibacteria bacterium]
MMNPNEPNYGQLPVTPQPQQPLQPQPQVQTQPYMQPPVQPQFQQQPQPQPQTQPAMQAGQPGMTTFGIPEGAAPTPGTPQNPYDFIVNPQVDSKKSKLGNGNNAMRILLVVGGIVTVLIVIAFVFVTIFSKSTPSPSLTAIVQQQQEIIRIATQGEQQAGTDTTKNLAYNIDLSVGTSQSQLKSYLAKHNVKITAKELALKKDPNTDKLLMNAKATSTYESALQKVFASQLQTYISDLQKAYDDTSSKTLRTVLADSYKAGKTLLNQANGTTTAATTPSP